MSQHWREATDTLLAPLLKAERLGVITDMDGTISHITDTPEAASVTETSRTTLRKLGEQVALIGVISGRGAADIHERLGIDTAVYVGNHGLERWVDGGVRVVPEAQPYLEKLQAALAEIGRAQNPDGFRIEDKGATASLHYRLVNDPQTFAEEYQPVVEAIAADHGLRVFQGRMVFEIRPPIEIHKGAAFAALVEEFDLDAAIYLGDDTTDVDAIKVASQLRSEEKSYGVGLGVESGDDTPAAVRDHSDLLVSGVEDVEAFFDWLSTALSASST